MPNEIPQLGQLEHIDPRSIWKHEAHDFTPWLADNASHLADALGIEIEIVEPEHAGRFIRVGSPRTRHDAWQAAHHREPARGLGSQPPRPAPYVRCRHRSGRRSSGSRRRCARSTAKRSTGSTSRPARASTSSAWSSRSSRSANPSLRRCSKSQPHPTTGTSPSRLPPRQAEDRSTTTSSGTGTFETRTTRAPHLVQTLGNHPARPGSR